MTKTTFTILIIICLVVGASIFSYQMYLDSFPVFFPTKEETVDLRGSFGALGDFFGGILNPLVAFSSVVLLVLTIFKTQEALNISQETLKETKKQSEKTEEALKLNERALNNSVAEMEITRKEIEGSKKAQEELVKSAEAQRIDASFFESYKIYSNLIYELQETSSYELMGRNFSELHYKPSIIEELLNPNKGFVYKMAEAEINTLKSNAKDLTGKYANVKQALAYLGYLFDTANSINKKKLLIATLPPFVRELVESREAGNLNNIGEKIFNAEEYLKING